MPDITRTSQIGSLQVLRGVAALIVFFAHWLPLTLNVPFTFGTVGVDLFFVISGFIMVYASERHFGSPRSVWAFIKSRLIRIVPLYWVVTTFTYLFTANFRHDLSLWQVVGSYLFFPVLNPTGDYSPILMVGWTLNLEMFFYALFAFAVMLPRRKAVAALSAALVGLVVISPTTQPLAFWSSPLILEFVFGMWIAILMREGLRFPVWLCCIMAVGGIALMVLAWGDDFSALSRIKGWGGGAALVVAACVLSDTNEPPPSWMKPMLVLGDASYALYLVHVPAIAICIWLGIPASVCFAIVIFCAVFANHLDEKLGIMIRTKSSRLLRKQKPSQVPL